ncbi:hypothetical protein QD460_25975 [Rhizobium jaguaris]|uniref:hypothetical protein n=1 Tax=Rhizobium jaguaris TaxID=1312183 RepID=UPI0039BF3C3D
MDHTTIIVIIIMAAPLVISCVCMGGLGVVVALVYYAALVLSIGSLLTTGSALAGLAGFLISTAVWIFVLYAGYEARK